MSQLSIFFAGGGGYLTPPGWLSNLVADKFRGGKAIETRFWQTVRDLMLAGY